MPISDAKVRGREEETRVGLGEREGEKGERERKIERKGRFKGEWESGE
jgi:hypothetical protein